MERLNKAYDITFKYGISLYDFGPYLSLTNNKIGICLNIKDDKYDYLTRNFCFDDLTDFEKFIKKYAYYKHVLKSNSRLLLDNYKCVSPNISYEFEKEELLKKENDQKELNLIKDKSIELVNYLEKLYEERVDKLILRDKLRMNMENLLLEYKKNLHLFYGKEYTEELNNILDNTINNYQKEAKRNIESLKKYLNELVLQTDLKEGIDKLDKIIGFLKSLECDENYFSLLYNMSLYEGKISVIEKMNEKIILELNKESRIHPKLLKTELEKIKNSWISDKAKEEFIRENLQVIEKKYQALSKVDKFNVSNFLNNKEFTKNEIFINSLEQDKKIKNDYSVQYNLLTREEKNILLLLFSPCRKLIKYIINLDSKTFNIEEFNEYEDMYNDFSEKIKLTDNLIFRERYLKDIDFSTFELFINSFADLTKNLKNISFIVNVDEEYYTYDNSDSLVFASREILKPLNETVNSLLVKSGARVLYSKYRIRCTNDKFIIEENEDIFIVNNENNFIYCGKEEQVEFYKPILEKKTIKNKLLTIATGMKEIGECTYLKWIVEGKDE